MAKRTEQTNAAGSVVKTPEFVMDFFVTLSAIVTPEEGGGYSAEVTDLPGCYTEAETLDALGLNLREAAEGWLRVHGEQVRELRGTRAP